jgi:hypothetical protein
VKTNPDLFLAIARKLGGERSALIIATLQQFEYADIFATKFSEDEFSSRLQQADEDPGAAFKRLYEPIKERLKSRSFGGSN